MGGTERIEASPGIEIAVRRVGSGDRAVLFVHGWMVSGAVWNWVLEDLAREDRTLVIPDQRGSGASSKPDTGYGLPEYAGDLLAVADRLGLERFTVVGHSMGGQIAQYLAAHHADRVEALALLNPVPASGVPLPAEPAAMFRGSGANREAQGHILDAACKELGAEAKAALVADAANVATASVEQAFDTWTAGGFADRLGDIRVPTLVVATDDPFLPPPLLQEHVTDRIAGARQEYLAGPGHYPNVERPAETVALLEAFLAETGA